VQAFAGDVAVLVLSFMGVCFAGAVPHRIVEAVEFIEMIENPIFSTTSTTSSLTMRGRTLLLFQHC
jgi:glucokinase